MERQLPIYRMSINDGEEAGVSYVALVDEPAIQTNWFAFKDQRFKFNADPERRIITGALMIADLPIYRNTPEMGEFYVVFDKEQIEKIAQRFFKNSNTSKVNLMHDPNLTTEGVYMFESMIVDSKRGIKPPEGFAGATEGSWFGSFKVDNDEVWQMVKDGTFLGFSVEGKFDLKPEKKSEEEEILKQIEEILGINPPQ